jgi:hypothetical protein
MADENRKGATSDRTSGTNQELGDPVDASGATQGASAPPGDAADTRGQQGDGVQDTPEITGDQREVGRVGQDEATDTGEGGYGGSSGFEGARA